MGICFAGVDLSTGAVGLDLAVTTEAPDFLGPWMMVESGGPGEQVLPCCSASLQCKNQPGGLLPIV